MRRKNRHWLPRLDEQRFIRFQGAERRQDGVKRGPVAGRPAAATVDDQVVRVKRYLRIEVVLEHPVGGFDLPVLARELGPARGLDNPGHCRLLEEERQAHSMQPTHSVTPEQAQTQMRHGCLYDNKSMAAYAEL